MCNRFGSSVSERDRYVGDSQASRDLTGLPVKGQGRPPSRMARYLKVSPPDAAAPSRAYGFHAGFFGRKARRKTLDAVCLRLTIKNLALREYASQKPVPEAPNRSCNPRNFHDIDARTHNHRVKLSQANCDAGICRESLPAVVET